MTGAQASHASLRLGFWAGVWIAVGTLASGPLAMLVVAITHPQPPWRDGAVLAAHYHPIQTLPFFCGFALIFGFSMLLAALHALAPPALRARATLALVFGAAFAALISLNYILQTTFVPALVHANPRDDDALAMFSMASPSSLAWALEMWGYAALGVATWLGAPVLSGTGSERVTAALLVANGPVSVAGGVLTALVPGWVLRPSGFLMFALWNVLALAIGVASALAFRARLPALRTDRDPNLWRAALAAISGALLMLLCFATPFLRRARSHAGTTAEDAAREHAGDHHVPEPTWQWTHAIRIAAAPEAVWPFVAQLGQSKAGFYSYELIENLAGCQIRNATRIHPEWQEPHVGDPLYLHPKAPPLVLTQVEPGAALVACAGVDPKTFVVQKEALAAPRTVAVSWAFLLEPSSEGGCVLKSRYRCACSNDLGTRLAYGASLIEPVGFAMDRRMLAEIKRLAERGVSQRDIDAQTTLASSAIGP